MEISVNVVENPIVVTTEERVITINQVENPVVVTVEERIITINPDTFFIPFVDSKIDSVTPVSETETTVTYEAFTDDNISLGEFDIKKTLLEEVTRLSETNSAITYQVTDQAGGVIGTFVLGKINNINQISDNGMITTYEAFEDPQKTKSLGQFTVQNSLIASVTRLSETNDTITYRAFDPNNKLLGNFDLGKINNISPISDNGTTTTYEAFEDPQKTKSLGRFAVQTPLIASVTRLSETSNAITYRAFDPSNKLLGSFDLGKINNINQTGKVGLTTSYEAFEDPQRTKSLGSFGITQPSTRRWGRPPLFLDFPEIQGQLILILLAVFPSTVTANTLSFAVSGAFQVNWGDGTTLNYNSGTTVSRTYDFNSISSNTFIEPEGFRQVIVRITPQTNNNITSFQLGTVNTSYPNPILEIVFDTPSLTTLSFGNPWEINRPPRRTTRSVILRQASVTNFTAVCEGFSFLRYFSFPVNSPTPATLNTAFRNCTSLELIDNMPTIATGSMQSTFEATGLKIIPQIDVSSVTNFSFIIPRQIIQSRLFGGKYSISYAFNNLGTDALNEIMNNLGTAINSSQSLNITNNPGAATCDIGLATTKGYTVQR